MGTHAPFLQRVRIRNYKSIGKCDVDLRPLTILVGRNSAGKSNFLDALRFVADSLQTTMDHAVKARGGLDGVRRRSTGHPRNFGIELQLALPDWRTARFGFEVSARTRGGFAIKEESLTIQRANGIDLAHYRVRDGKVVERAEAVLPTAASDRLFLVSVSGIDEFRDAYLGLSTMGFYNLNPDAMKELQSPDAGELLHRDGSNIASVMARLGNDKAEIMARIHSYLQTIVPGIAGVRRIALGPRETLEFRQEVKGSRHPWKFYATSVSDGTLRALGTLAAVMQLADGESPVPLVGIEEPETALHPAAAGALMDALSEAAAHTQVIVTSHSGVLLDEIDIEEHGLLVVVAEQGKTEIAAPDEASLEAIREHLYSVGDLQRMDQLEPNQLDLQRQRQLRLFNIEEDDG